GLELLVGEGLVLLLQGVHLVGDGVDGLQLSLGGGPKDFGEQAHRKHLSVVDLNPVIRRCSGGNGRINPKKYSILFPKKKEQIVNFSPDLGQTRGREGRRWGSNGIS